MGIRRSGTRMQRVPRRGLLSRVSMHRVFLEFVTILFYREGR